MKKKTKVYNPITKAFYAINVKKVKGNGLLKKFKLKNKMTQPKVDNKRRKYDWVTGVWDKLFATNSLKPILRALDKPLGVIYRAFEAGEAEEIHLEIAKVVKQLITQTQQETLEWCLKEAFPEWIHNPNGEINDYTRGRRDEREQMRQTIKQRIKSLDKNEN